MRGEPDRLVFNEEFYETHKYVADKGQGVIRLDKFLSDRIFQISRSRVQTAIKAGLVKVNGDEEKSNYKIRPNDVVEMLMPKPMDEAVKIVPDKIPLNIVYEDDDLLVINKPAGMVVHPGVGVYRRTLVNALAYYFQDLPVMEGNPDNRPGLVHRIDKDTSGLLVVAKSDFAMMHLAKQFHDHTIHRRYHAIIWGEFEEDSGRIENWLGRHTRFRKKMTVVDDGEGKLAITHWKVLERLYYVSHMELRLETGRTHQIRVHMSSLGHPLFNDPRYGGDRIVKGTIFSKYKQFVENCFEILPRQALHAKEIGFVHPRTGKQMMFDSELPMPMVDCLNRWRTYVADRRNKLTLEQE